MTPIKHFSTVAGLWLAVCVLAMGLCAGAAAAISASELSHIVPANKALPRGWVRNLFLRGKPERFRGRDLTYIGMPVGGIGAGQLYLCGDGALGCWEIFNQYTFRGTGGKNYDPIPPSKPVDQGLAVVIDAGTGFKVRTLDARGFADVVFRGEYPIGTVEYADPDFPLKVRLEAFSPFIPLNSPDSALPATILAVTLINPGGTAVRAGCIGWLENAVCLGAGKTEKGVRRTRFSSKPGRTWLVHDATPPPARKRPAQRPPIVLENFEGTDYGEWQAEGPAFGSGPAHGTLAGQQAVSGFLGKGLVNTFLGGDKPQGTLTSPEFTINRRFLNFLIGGGNHPNGTCIDLLVDGQRVRTATGRSEETLRWQAWDVSEFAGRHGRIRIVDHNSDGWGHINIDQIELSDRSRAGDSGPIETRPDFGTLALAFTANTAPVAEVHAILAKLHGPRNRDFVVRKSTRKFPARQNAVLVSRLQSVPPGGKRLVTFVLAWDFPNTPHGHEYAARFQDAAAVAGYVLDNLPRLSGNTHLWRDTYYDSTLPYWLLDRVHAPVSNLATGTCQWWENGRFWAFEGVVCCAGTCTHVWNYAQAHAYLFPGLARSIRKMQDFCPTALGGGFHPDTGLVGFRGNDAYAADGQCGSILKAYREHRLAPDATFLHQYWPRIRKALEYCMKQDAEDGKPADGIIENTQHNTYDINYVGANTFVGALYLAALRAGEEMAKEMNDAQFARRCRALFESGRRISLERLWNGEYFIQDVDLAKHPKYQYGRGCLADQLFGQTWADLLGLGPLYPPRNIRSALDAVWKYNWAPDVGPQYRAHPPGRRFAAPGEPGLLICTWPKSPYLDQGTLYKNEVWTGIEYEVATAMIWDGLLTQGLAICRGVHDRYRPCRRNPYNEVECGDHYARSLASWGVLLALGGFEYNGPAGHIGFAPRITPQAFRTPFTAAEGWGTFTQTRRSGFQSNTIEVKWGRLRMTSVALDLPPAATAGQVVAAAGNVPLRCRTSQTGSRLLLTLAPELILDPGRPLRIIIRLR